MQKKYLWFITLVLLVALVIAWRFIMSNIEHAKYKVVRHQGQIEIRDYEAMIVAEVQVEGDREAAISEGFSMIADYIFGNNVSLGKEPMTMPVTQKSSEKIAMTAPVQQQSIGSHSWKVNFIMPYSYTLATLPIPINIAVKMKKISEKRFAVIRFSGIANSSQLEDQTKELENFIAQQKLYPIARPTYAFFNPPWTLPFLRRNEVMIEIKK